MHLTPPKSETHRVRLTEGVNLVGRKRDARTTTADSVTIKTHRNRAMYYKMAPYQPEFYDHILWCVQICVQSSYIAKLEYHNLCFNIFGTYTALYVYYNSNG